MTIINRALHKVYTRRSEDAPASGPETTEAVPARGWASGLRRPAAQTAPSEFVLRRDARPAGAAQSAPESAAAGTGPVVAPQPVSSADNAVVALPASTRIDPPHLVAAKREADESPVESDGPAVLPIPRSWSWPAIVPRLLACPAADGLRELAAHLKRLAAEHDLRCVALSGAGRNAGRTSLLLTLAHILAEEASLRLAVVDADFTHPSLATMLSLEARLGLWNAASGRKEDAAEALTRLTDSLTAVPLTASVPLESIARDQIAALQSFLRSLRRDNGLVLVDAGPWESLVPPLIFESRAIDAFISVCRCDTPEDERIDEAHAGHPGLEWLGTVETFAATPAGGWPQRQTVGAALPDRLKPQLRAFAP